MYLDQEAYEELLDRVARAEERAAELETELTLADITHDTVVDAQQKAIIAESEARALRERVEAVAKRIGRHGDPQGASGDYGVIGATLAKTWILEALRG